VYVYRESNNQALETMRRSEQQSSSSGCGRYGAKILGSKNKGYCMVHLGKARSVILFGCLWKLLYLRWFGKEM
jgi:hypothetical protein